jgi:hypothetical protein
VGRVLRLLRKRTERALPLPLGERGRACDASLRDPADRWAIVAFVLSLSPEQRPSMRLADYAGRPLRIGPGGHVLPGPSKR